MILETTSSPDGLRRSRMASMAELTPLMREILSQGGSVELTTTGSSMRPMLWHRKSRVRLAGAEGLKRGDVPLYQRDSGAYVLHRVVRVEPEGCTMCGDGQWSLERNIRPEQVIAVMTHFTWRGRWISRENPAYGCYWRLWLALRPMRRYLFGAAVRLKGLLDRGK